MDFRHAIDAALAPLRQTVRGLILRAVVSGSDASQQIQTVGLDLGDEQIPDCEHFEPFGLTANPASDSEAVVVFAGASHDHPIVTGVVDRRHRPTGLASGESAVYNGHGTVIALKADGSIQITVGAGQAVVVNGDVTAGGISLKNHKHAVVGTAPSGGGSVVFTPVGTTGGPS